MPGRGTGERLAVDPKNSEIIFFGARSGNGLWKSTDAGEQNSIHERTAPRLSTIQISDRV